MKKSAKLKQEIDALQIQIINLQKSLSALILRRNDLVDQADLILLSEEATEREAAQAAEDGREE